MEKKKSCGILIDYNHDNLACFLNIFIYRLHVSTRATQELLLMWREICLRWHCHPAAFYYLTEHKFKTRYDKFARSCRTAVQDGMFISFLVGFYLLRFYYVHSTKSIKAQCENVQLENLRKTHVQLEQMEKDYRWPAMSIEETCLFYIRFLQEISKSLEQDKVQKNDSVFIPLLFCTVNTGKVWNLTKMVQTEHCENYLKTCFQKLTVIFSKLCIHHLYFVFDI